MSYNIGKKNRLKEKFNFKLRDWHIELDGIEEFDPPAKSKERAKSKREWRQNRRHSDNH